MTSSEIFGIYTKIELIMQEHHLKDAMPKLAKLKDEVGKLYHDVRQDEIDHAEDAEPSEEEKPTTSDEEFVAGEDSIEYDSSDSSSDDSSDCEEGCTCEACNIH